MWSYSFITHDWRSDQLLLPQILRGLPQVFAVAPVVNLGLGSLPPDRLKFASGLFNMMRNLGGAVGPRSSMTRPIRISCASPPTSRQHTAPWKGCCTAWLGDMVLFRAALGTANRRPSSSFGTWPTGKPRRSPSPTPSDPSCSPSSSQLCWFRCCAISQRRPRHPATRTSGLIYSDDSQIGRSSPSSHYESRNCRQRHASRSPPA